MVVLDRFGLKKRVNAERALDPRTAKGKGYDPVVYVAGILLSLTSGGCSLKGVEALNEDEALKGFLDGTLHRARPWPDVVADLRSRDAASLWSGSTARGAVVTKR